MVQKVTLAEVDADPHGEVFDSGPRTVKLDLAAGERVPAHSHPDRSVVVLVRSGELALHVDDEVLDLTAGDVARFDGARTVEPVARTATSALIVLAPSGAE